MTGFEKRWHEVLGAGKLLPTLRSMRSGEYLSFVGACQRAKTFEELPEEPKQVLLNLEAELAAPLDVDSVWSVAGNIVEERAFGPVGEASRRGTRLFRAGAKVYLASLRHCWSVQDPEPPAHESLEVVGRHRGSGRWLLA